MKRAVVLLLALCAFHFALAQESLPSRWNRFVATENRWAKEYNAGQFDLVLARQLSREWRAVEDSGEWPR